MRIEHFNDVPNAHQVETMSKKVVNPMNNMNDTFF